MLGKPGLREDTSALAIEERQNNQRLGRPGLKDDAIKERLNNQRLGRLGLRYDAIKNNQRLGRPGLEDNERLNSPRLDRL